MKITCAQVEDSASMVTIEFVDFTVARIFPKELTKQETANRLQSMAAALRGDVKMVSPDET